MITSLLNRKGYTLLLTVMLAILPICSCRTLDPNLSQSTIEHRDGVVNLHTLAIRFSPRIYMHADEPYGIIGIFPVFHPEQPLIAYHIFFEDDALLPGRGKETDHEIVWVEYDPITLKVTDVATLWHRTVLRTDKCIMNAKASQQRPAVLIQWGQHGILPFGWETLRTARPTLELIIHYNLVKLLAFQGSYKKYLRFSVEVDAADYVRNQKIVVAEYSEKYLKKQVKKTFKLKKEWPFWSPTD